MSRKNSRAKGQSGQREAAMLWRKAGFPDAQNSGLMQAGKLGGIRNSTKVSDVTEIGRWHCEVKRYTEYTDKMVRDWWLKCIEDCPATHDPILMYRANREGWLVMTKDYDRAISWDSFVVTLKKARKKRGV
jgi:hypothetical protein